MRRFSRTSLGVALFLLASRALADQPALLTDEMVERSEKGKNGEPDLPPEPKERSVGDEFVDNPDWLEKKIRAEKKAAKKAREEAAQSARGDSLASPGYIPGYQTQLGVGLSPLAPQGNLLAPAGTTPSFGARDSDEGYRFKFHGYIQSGLRASIGSREDALSGQSKTTIHGDPIVPGAAFGWFEHTGVVPTPWAQLNFEFGNDRIRATAILGAFSFSQSDEAAGYFQAPAQLGFFDAFLTYTPDLGPVGFEVRAGVFNERYGSMGEYDTGPYQVSFIGQVLGSGATATLSLPYDNGWTVTAEAGFKGDYNTPPVGIVSDQSNEYARPIEGSTFAGHGHLTFDYEKQIEVTAHGIHSFSQDDRGDELEGRDVYLEDRARRDGSIQVLGADARLRLKRFGYLYLGASRVALKDSLSVSNLVQILNNGGGRDFAERFISYESGGTGTLSLAGAQYSLSLGNLLRHPLPATKAAPDIALSAFGIYAHQSSPLAAFDDVERLKFGVIFDYGMSENFAFATRFDRVMPNLGRGEETFSVISPELRFRNTWTNQANLTLRYSAYLLGDETQVRGDHRLLNNASGDPDRHALALFGTLWW